MAFMLVLAAACAAEPLAAQVASDTIDVSNCRAFNGIYVDAWWGGASDSTRARGDSGGFRLDGRSRIDTVFDFAVAEKRWTRSSVTAVVVAGVSHSSISNAGGTVVPASASRDASRDWHVCTGATLSGRQPTLLLRGVRGRMRLKVDLSPLTQIRGAGISDTTRTERR
jgi:hypothetical protein